MSIFCKFVFVCVVILLNNMHITCEGDTLKTTKKNPYPIVLWHGMGDYWCNPLLNSMKTFLETHLRNVQVISIKIGSSILDDLKNGYLMNVNEQINMVCNMLSQKKKLQNGFNAIGFSQAAQFFRGVAERCPKPPIINLISLGGQHQGVYGFPRCSARVSKFCNYFREFLSSVAYTNWIQKHVVQAQFWHDPLNEDVYRKYSIFLSDINNELSKNQTYKDNLLKLKNFVLIEFSNDTIVDPIESEWFGFYKPGQGNDTYTLQQSSLYQEDWLGLKQLELSGKLHFLSMPGDHMEINWNWFLENVIKPFLS